MWTHPQLFLNMMREDAHCWPDPGWGGAGPGAQGSVLVGGDEAALACCMWVPFQQSTRAFSKNLPDTGTDSNHRGTVGASNARWSGLYFLMRSTPPGTPGPATVVNILSGWCVLCSLVCSWTCTCTLATGFRAGVWCLRQSTCCLGPGQPVYGPEPRQPHTLPDAQGSQD